MTLPRTESGDQWDRMQILELHPRVHGQLILDKGSKHAAGQGQCLQHTVLGELDKHSKSSETGPLSHTTYKINSKWIKDFNISPDTRK